MQAYNWPSQGDACATMPHLFQPGTQWSYCNSNHFALGAVIEKVTGQSYETNLNQ
jgi:D-alanyl-D-alanine carboxypeptidase